MSGSKSNSDKGAGNSAASTREVAPTGAISRKLRAFYDQVQDQTIPDRFLDLLEKLDDVESASNRTAKE